jgi:hypothetical protein
MCQFVETSYFYQGVAAGSSYQGVVDLYYPLSEMYEVTYLNG